MGPEWSLETQSQAPLCGPGAQPRKMAMELKVPQGRGGSLH